MSQHRWSKFWWQDWQRDPALRSCNVAARGLWIDMLAIAFDGAPRGFVTIGGKPATTKQLATICGVPERQCVTLLAELEDAGVFSRNADGWIFSRRMVRDSEVSEAGREAIAKRWQKSEHPISPPIREGHSPPHSLEAEAEAEAEADSKKVESAPRAAAPTTTKRGCRLPDDWVPAEPHYAGVDPASTLDRFRDYWRAASGAKAVKSDWQAAWRMWCRREVEYQANKPKPKLHTQSPAEQDRRILAAVGLRFDDPPPVATPIRIAR